MRALGRQPIGRHSLIQEVYDTCFRIRSSPPGKQGEVPIVEANTLQDAASVNGHF